MNTAPKFADVVESVEQLSPADQEALVELIRHRLAQRRREEIAVQVAEARASYGRGEARPTGADDLMTEILE
jgi:hypothetical protein